MVDLYQPGVEHGVDHDVVAQNLKAPTVMIDEYNVDCYVVISVSLP